MTGHRDHPQRPVPPDIGPLREKFAYLLPNEGPFQGQGAGVSCCCHLKGFLAFRAEAIPYSSSICKFDVDIVIAYNDCARETKDPRSTCQCICEDVAVRVSCHSRCALPHAHLLLLSAGDILIYFIVLYLFSYTESGAKCYEARYRSDITFFIGGPNLVR